MKKIFLVILPASLLVACKDLDKQFRTKPRAEAWARKNIIIKD